MIDRKESENLILKTSEEKESIEAKKKENIAKKRSDNILELYQDRTLVEEILNNLDNQWKKGDEIIDRIDLTINRYEAMITFFEYLVVNSSKLASDENSEGEDNDSEVESFFEISSLADGEKIKDFLDGLVRHYSKLEKPFREYLFNKKGIVNHLSAISIDGIHYTPELQTIQAAFSLYTFDRKIFYSKDDIDDFIWLSQNIMFVVVRAITKCQENGSHISENYRKILRKRFEVMGESYKELEKLIEELDSTSESIDLSD
jgi:hypothetical protein